MRRRYLIDSTPLTAYLPQRPAALQLLAPHIRDRAAATSVLVYAEVHEYPRGRSQYVRREQELRELLREIHPQYAHLPHPPAVR